MEQRHVDAIEEIITKYPSHVVVRCLADTIANRAEAHTDVVRRQLMKLANALHKEANMFRYL